MSTVGVPPRERLARWGDILWRLFGSLHSESFGDPQFDARLEMASLEDLRLCRIEASRHRVFRTAREARRDGSGDLKVIAQLAGSAWFEQSGRRVLLSPGDWSVYDTSRPYVVSNLGPVTHMVMLLPRERLRHLDVPIENLSVRRFSGRCGAGRVAFRALSQAMDTWGEAEREADWLAGVVAEGLLEASGTATAGSQREAMRERVLAFVDSRLGDPRLNLDAVAAAMGCGKRNLHKLFRGGEESLGEYIWRERLARAREDLAAGPALARSITDIAFSWGFSSSPHFSRAFRERYGVSPRTYRSQVAPGRGWDRLSAGARAAPRAPGR